MKDKKRSNLEGINLDDYISHETCNAPPQEILNKYGIFAVGEIYGVQPRERLLIPKKLLKRKGYPLDAMDKLSIISTCERLLVKIEREYKEKYNKT